MTIAHRPRFGKSQTTTLLPEGVVLVVERSLGVEHSYRVSVAQLSPHYTRYRDSQMGSVIAAVFLFFLGVCAFYFRFPPPPSGNEWTFMLIGSILWAMAAVAYCHRLFGQTDVILFLDREQKRALLSIPRQSGSEDFDAFLKQLLQQIPSQ